MATATRRSGSRKQQSTARTSRVHTNGSGGREAGERAARAAAASRGSSARSRSTTAKSKAASRSSGASARGSSGTPSRQNGSGASRTRGRAASTRGRTQSGSSSRAKAAGNGSSGTPSNGSGRDSAGRGSQSAQDIAKHVGLSVATGTLGAAAGIAGGVLLGRTAGAKKPRKILGVKLPAPHKADLSGLSDVAKSVNEAGRQFGKLASEVREARRKAEEIGKALR